MEYVAAVDQGTTSTRVILFDAQANPVCSHHLGHQTFAPHRDWEEHDPLEILNNVKLCIDECMARAKSEHAIAPSQVKAIGITNQRETTVVWNKHTGVPLYNAIVWRDLRTQSTCDALRVKHDSEKVRQITGLPISTYFSGVKLRWLIDNIPAVQASLLDGSALFGTIDTWLVWNLSAERVHVTDVTNAGRTMLMNLQTLKWDEHMMQMIGITKDILPEIRSCREHFGSLADTSLKGVPINGIIGDQQAALVGQSCFDIGDAKSTYGTGCFLIVNTGTTPRYSRNGLLATPGYKLGSDQPCVYSLEGSVAVAGTAVDWLRDGLGVIGSAAESEALARSVPDTGDVYVVPAFSGLYAPWWREDARGTVVGMTRTTTKAHVVRATLESMAFKVDAVLRSASEDMGAGIAMLKVDGGVSRNNLVMEMQADITGTTVVRPRVTETTSLGAAFVAGKDVGVFQSMEGFRKAWKLDAQFEPQIDVHLREQKVSRWAEAVQRSLGWVQQSGTKNVDIPLKAENQLTQLVWRDLAVGVCVGAVATFIILRKR